MKKIIIALMVLLSTLVNHASAQERDNIINVKMNGYIISMKGEMLFQPCEDSTKDIWSSLDNRSFSIWCNDFIDQYCGVSAYIGDSSRMKLSTIDDTVHIEDVPISYYYCTLDINMNFLSKSEDDFHVYDTPKYMVWHNDKKIVFNGFYIRESVNSIIPFNKKKLLMMYNYYKNKHYAVPDWLKLLVKN